jgi:tRNA (mo5U34)-methyltransferase
MAEDASEIRWWHSIDLGGGNWTPGMKTPQVIQAEAEAVFQKGVAGKTVLDVGAWDGFFSFEAERRGASRVLATDHIAWSGWGWGTKEGFDYAHQMRGSCVESLDIDVPEICPAMVGLFDVVLFLGVLYHLKDPYGGLEHISKVVGDTLIVETVTALNDFPEPVARYYYQDELNGDSSNFWAPNTQCLELMLREVGFSTVEIVRCPSWPGHTPGQPITGRHIAFAQR